MMAIKSTTLAALAVGMIAPGPATADDRYLYADVAEIIFTSADANEDGIMTRSEHAVAGLDRWGSAFSDLDLNGDGSVSRNEYRIFFEMRHKPARPY
jgi:hypothetical protein